MVYALLQLLLFLALTLMFVKPLGLYMAKIYTAKRLPGESRIYRCIGVSPDVEMNWVQYLMAMLCFNMLAIFLSYFIQRWQAFLPLNPNKFSAVTPDLAFNTAISMVTNTGWQAYGGENSLSYFAQLFVITAQGFFSAATGMALMVAFIRGLARRETTSLGNFWVDMLRSVLFILLPISLVLAMFLVAQGVIQNFQPYVQATVLDATPTVAKQTIPMGPVASLLAINQLGSCGAGFFNVSAAHPFANPTTWTNLLQLLAIILIPAAACYTFGVLVNDRRQGWMLFVAMATILVIAAVLVIHTEGYGNPNFVALGVAPENNMEGKEVRFGITYSALWGVITTATGNGSVNSMHDSFMPLSGGILILLMHLGEIVFGGVGSGLYSMILMVIITVFIAGLMVGRTPEFLGKKIEPFEMKMVTLMAFVMPLIVLIFAALGCVTTSGVAALGNPQAHGLSEILYAFTSMRNNNGSAFAGLSANTQFYNILGGIIMLAGRYWVAICTMAVAGALAKKKVVPASSGTLPTHNLSFIILLINVIVILGALSILPILALGPIVEHLDLWGINGY